MKPGKFAGWIMLFALGGVFSAMACKASRSASSELESVVYTGRLWPNPKAIPVCIVNSNEVDPDLVTDIRQHVSQDFLSKAGINLQGWSACSAADYESQMIRVYFERSHDWSGRGGMTAGGGLSAVGPTRNACGGCAGGTMLLKIGNDGGYPVLDAPRVAFIKRQTRATAVHEFGHALGLLHEHERFDGPGCRDFPRTDMPSSQRGIQFVGAYDPDSIMNYCHNSELHSLSSGDVAGLAYLYPEAASSTPSAPNQNPPLIDSLAGEGASDQCRPQLEKPAKFARTEYTGGKVQVSFRNRCTDPLELIWLDSQGQSRSYGVMAPGDLKTMITYEGHSWRFENKVTQQLVREFRIAGWMQNVSVP